MRFEVQPDDTISNGQLFIEMNADKTPGGPDGMKVDQKGNVYCTGPGGLWIMSSEGIHLGILVTSELTANLSFGGADGKTLFLCARTGSISNPLEDTWNIPGKEIVRSRAR
jgi:gluconolactonase